MKQFVATTISLFLLASASAHADPATVRSVDGLPQKTLLSAGPTEPGGVESQAGSVPQTMKNSDRSMTMREFEDKMALRELVDTFSILADKKEARKQADLFTENATVETYISGKLATKLTGKEGIASTFENFLKNFTVVYHFNGQHLVSIQGDRATGTLYCLTYLFDTENGKSVKTSIGVRYHDEYVRKNGTWLISKRVSFFDWLEKETRP